MDLEEQPWITDFRIAAALDSFPFLWVLKVWVFSYRFLLNVSCVLGSGLVVAQGTFSEFLGLVWEIVSVYFVLLTPPAQGRAVAWVIGPLSCGKGLSIFHVLVFFVLPTTPRSKPGAIRVFRLV